MGEKCAFCGKNINLVSRLVSGISYYIDSNDEEIPLHAKCYPLYSQRKDVERFMEKLISLGHRMSKVENKFLSEGEGIKKKVELLDQHIDTMNADIISNRDYAKLSLEESRKVLLWLETNSARRSDKENLAMFDPILIEMLSKYTGMEIEEIAREIKNKELKRMLNKMDKKR